MVKITFMGCFKGSMGDTKGAGTLAHYDFILNSEATINFT